MLADQGAARRDDARSSTEIELPVGINALLDGAPRPARAPGRATRSSAARSRARCSTAAPSSSCPSRRRARPCRRGSTTSPAATSSGRPPEPSPARPRSGSSTSSSARPPTARRRRSSAPTCTSGSPTGSSGSPATGWPSTRRSSATTSSRPTAIARELGSLDDEARALGERAAAHLAAAAARAEALSDFDADANLLERALAIGFAEPHARVRVQAELGSALGQTRRVAEADAVLTEAYETATRLGEREIAAAGARPPRLEPNRRIRRLTASERQAEAEEAIVTLDRARRRARARRRTPALGAFARKPAAGLRTRARSSSSPSRRGGLRRRRTAPKRRSTRSPCHYIVGPTPVPEAIAPLRAALELGRRRSRPRSDPPPLAGSPLRDGRAAETRRLTPWRAAGPFSTR